MHIRRRDFLKLSSAGGLGMAAGLRNEQAAPGISNREYNYRIAFDVWINDVRNESMPLENWPYGVLDDRTVDGIIRALDAQAASGYNIIDPIGFWSTYGWPVDIKSAADKDRVRRINQILKAAHDRKIKVITFPSGIMNWGLDEIIKQNPAVQSDNKHIMNPLREESWQWGYRIFDYVMDNYDFDGFHLESADQGRCRTNECMEKWPDSVAYHCYVTGRMAEHIRQKKPSALLIATIQNFSTWGQGLNEAQKAYLVDLSKKVDCLVDQGHRGTYIPPSEQPSFIKSLHCAYGTSGGIWVYPPQRWDRNRWFLPYTARCGKHIADLYNAGGRGIMYYQGPVVNAGTEVNIAFGGRIMKKPDRSIDDVLSDTLEALYRPKNQAAHRKLIGVFQTAEASYFDQWNEQEILGQDKRGIPGELHLTNLFGASPGPATYLMEPYLNTAGRLKYKEGLVSSLRILQDVEAQFDDRDRIGRIKEGISEALVDLNNIAKAKGEKEVWDDSNVGRRF